VYLGRLLFNQTSIPTSPDSRRGRGHRQSQKEERRLCGPSGSAGGDRYFFSGLGIGTFSSGTMRTRIAIFLAAFFFLGVFVFGMVTVKPEHFQLVCYTTCKNCRH
jgi:hypothetical protein